MLRLYHSTVLVDAHLLHWFKIKFAQLGIYFMSRHFITGMVLLIGVVGSVYAQEQDPRSLRGNPIAGKTKSETCVACHGLDGNAVNSAWPKIAGLSQTYIIQQLLDYQKGENGPRYDPTMYGMVQNLSAQDIADLAAYYATQSMTVGATPADKVVPGQNIYRGGNLATGLPACAACHGATGAGNYLANFPRMSGQNSGYVITQLNKFRDKQRSNDVNGIMRDIAAKMTDKEIEAVADYVAGLH